MMNPVAIESSAINVDSVIQDIRSNNLPALQQFIAQSEAGDIANLLAALLPEQRLIVWGLLTEQQQTEVMPLLRAEVRPGILGEMNDQQLIHAAEEMDVDDLAVIIGDISDQVTDSIIDALERDHRQRLETVLSFTEGTAGRLMRTEVLSVRQGVNFSVVLRWLRMHQKLPPLTDSLMVIDAEGLYLGKLPLADVVTGAADTLVKDAMIGKEEAVRLDAPEHEVAVLFEKRSLISIAVVNDEGKLCGRITVDDIVDVIRHEGDQALLKSGGISTEEDLFAPIVPSAKRRGIWLGINLLTVFIAVWVIGLFEEALEQIVALAVLMPVTASMGGIAGSQTLTLTIRGMALNQISRANTPWLVRKELAIGALNGLVWSLLVAAVSLMWFHDPKLSIIISLALILNFLAASFSGVVIPLILKRINIDPALSGAVILTTVTDVIGFLSFLGMASIFLLQS
ncbi:magnesium transporter [Motiliproteus sp. MSK22-1]|uniref:magnesium transporter n=1 Tax=Motiliproteus sp. MSK22-1 TaxID=1897630 RepID=UPI0009775900|nr:magnesium transporter [Motiliproteus sp. MSK22-1]OMH26261.1 magnesium transporter [Motiliproteus sp. MSK22-1]